MSYDLHVLGASDPEMSRIESRLGEAGIPFVHAKVGDARVNPGNAYAADMPSGATDYGARPIARLVFVECAPAGGRPAGSVVVDHHNPGDPGYACGPEDFLKGSSLGQVLALVGLEPTELDLLIAAGDHCPAAAYRGQCPGVDPEKLMELRAANIASFRKLPVDEVLAGVRADAAALMAAEKRLMGGQEVVVTPEPLPYGPEASLRTGVAIISVVKERDGRLKEVFLGGNAEAIAAFMADRKAAGREVYGNPIRGYAGAYLT